MFKRDQTGQYIEQNKINGKTRKFYKGRLLGKGGFAKCYQVEEQGNKDKYACKIIDKQQLSHKKMKQKLQSQISVHKKIKHPCIVKFQYVFEDEQFIYIILQLCINNTLNQLLKRRKLLTQIEVRYYLYHVLLAINYLHQQKIIHRDLKLDNFFLSQHLQVKVGDFGLATVINNQQKRKSICGTPIYIAPQILDGNVGYQYPVDIWSLGIVTFVLLYGRFPFDSSDIKTIGQRIKSKSYLVNPNVSDLAKCFIMKMLNMNPAERSTSKQLLEDQFLTAYQIPKMLPRSSLACTPNANFLQQYKHKKQVAIINQDDDQFNFMLCSKESKLNSTQHYQLPSAQKQRSMRKECQIELNLSAKKILSFENDCDLNQQTHTFSIKQWLQEWWLDPKSGLLYKTSDGVIGYRFNDGSNLTAHPFPTLFTYISPKHYKDQQFNLQTMNKCEIPEPVYHKMKIMKLKLQQKDIEQDQYCKGNGVYVKMFYDCIDIFVIWLSNGNLQAKFADKSQLIVAKDNCMFIGIDQIKVIFRSSALLSQNSDILKKQKHLQTFLKRVSSLKASSANKQNYIKQQAILTAI